MPTAPQKVIRTLQYGSVYPAHVYLLKHLIGAKFKSDVVVGSP